MLSLFPPAAQLLPQFKSLLIKGPYHISAPIHLAISHTAQSPESSVIVLSAALLASDLKEFNDAWLSTHSGHGSVMESSSRVQLYYPPSPAHMSLLLSSFHVPGASTDLNTVHPKITLRSAPTLIVLHEPSMYFLTQSQANEALHSWTVSSYISLVTRAMSLVSYFGSSSPSNTTSLAVFDSRLDLLKLPVVRQQSYRGHPFQGETPSLRAVSTLVQDYFEWIGVFDLESANEDSEEQPAAASGVDRNMRLRLNRSNSQEKEQHTWQWLERRYQLSECEKWRTEFVWRQA